TDNIGWTIALPGNPTGYSTPVHVVDTPAAGSVIDCATIALTTQDSLAGGTTKTAVDPARYDVTCSPSTFTIDLDRIGPSEFVTITYKGTIADQSSGSYANHVAVTIDGQTTLKDSTVKRTDAGGVGDGVQSVGVGDDVWLDADRDGIQDPGEKGIPGVTLALTGPDGKPVTGITGAPVADAVTDANGHYAFTGLPVLPAGQHYTVSIDAAASKTALTGLVPTTAHAGHDAALDSSTGSAQSTDLTTNGARDLTLDFGFVLPDEPDLPTLALPGDPETASSDTPAQLAHTGVDGVVPASIAGVLLIGLGAAVAIAARRRRTRA
ncbi:MAG TPA: SdrD B-like domain-containing protein, partial [Pseudolysinimonas sp.]|nr:SdrD B-like domain-containing protein [Pseudolysinimonas sp.]